MGKKLKRYTEDDLARAFGRSGTPPVGAKGTKENPYTREEFEALLEAGTWGGGYVGDEYIPAEEVLGGVTVRPSQSSSGSGGEGDGWYCPTCGHPYPPDAGSDYTRCSNCGSSLTPGSQVHPSPPPPTGGGGGGGNSDIGAGNPYGIRFSNFSPAQIAIIERFFSESVLSAELLAFIKEAGGILIVLDPALASPGLYNESVIYLRTDGNGEPLYNALFEEVAHFVQDHTGIMAQEENMVGHSNIEYQSKIMSLLMSREVGINGEQFFQTQNPFFIRDADLTPEDESYFYSVEEPISLSELDRYAQACYQEFLHYYGKDGEAYNPNYSEHDGGPNWNWKWKEALEAMGFSTKP